MAMAMVVAMDKPRVVPPLACRVAGGESYSKHYSTGTAMGGRVHDPPQLTSTQHRRIIRAVKIPVAAMMIMLFPIQSLMLPSRRVGIPRVVKVDSRVVLEPSSMIGPQGPGVVELVPVDSPLILVIGPMLAVVLVVVAFATLLHHLVRAVD